MSITLKEIKKDYKNLMDIIGNVTTVEQLKELENKQMFGYIKVDNRQYYSTNDYDNDGKYIKNPHYCEGYENINCIDNFILYGEYGCLGTIFVSINNGKVENAYFYVWEDEYDYIIAEQVTIDKVNEDSFDIWMNGLKDFLDYCDYCDEELARVEEIESREV